MLSRAETNACCSAALVAAVAGHLQHRQAGGNLAEGDDASGHG
jgi:hypothetical protein